MVLNLDKQFRINKDREIEFTRFFFSGGEPHIKINPNFDISHSIDVTIRLNSFNDLGFLCLAVDALKRLNANLGNLFIPYFPAARQDRVMVEGEALSVKVYAEIINALGFKNVTVFDPHSEVTSAVLRNSVVITNHNFIKSVIAKTGSDLMLISPDGGALKKIYKVSEFLGGIEVIECSKSRDVKTGQLEGFKVYCEDLKGKDCLIVDDICDGGGTFIGLAIILKSKNAGNLYLAVSHGIFSKGLDELGQHFKYIFTTNSFKDIDNTNQFQQLILEDGLLS